MKIQITAILTFPWRLLKWCYGFRYRLLLVVVLVFLALLGGSFKAYEFWSSPEFCRSCHIMEPYYKSWEHSSHSEVACVQCHFEPGIGAELHGKWVAVKQLAAAVTGAYSSMPYAEVSDQSCTRSGCHTPQELDKSVDFTKRGIQFKHELHAKEMRRGIKLACTSCHFQRLVNNHMEVDKSTCFLCHFKGARATHKPMGECDTCHGPPTKSTTLGRFEVDHARYVERGMRCVQCHSELISGTGAVGQERCLSCHNKPDQIEKISDPGLMHVEHITKRKMHCYQCHTMIAHRFDTHTPLDPKQDCVTCHRGPHSPQAMLYSGTGAKGVASIPDEMHGLGLDCVGCHREPIAEASTTNGPVQEHDTLPPVASCTRCHESRYTGFVTAVRNNLNQMLGNLEKRLSVVQEKVEGEHAAGRFLARPLYRQIEATGFNLQFIRKARPIHNPIYAIETLRASRSTLEKAEEALEIEDESDPPPGFEAEDCGVCHNSLPMPGVIALDGERKYPHSVHVRETGLGCADCHQGRQHPPPAPTAERSCRSCHENYEQLKKNKFKTTKKPK